jgi:hypothetical protein
VAKLKAKRVKKVAKKALTPKLKDTKEWQECTRDAESKRCPRNMGWETGGETVLQR